MPGYLAYNAVKFGIDVGTGLPLSNVSSSLGALVKNGKLTDVARHFFQDTSAYTGGDIAIGEVRKAIMYAASKKGRKAARQAAVGSAKGGLIIAAAAGGATVGSIVPVAGTVGGAVGGAIAGAALTPLVFVGDQMARKGKAAVKKWRDTLGKHRTQCANTLYTNASNRNGNRIKWQAANAALAILLENEYDELMGSGDIGSIARRIKSV